MSLTRCSASVVCGLQTGMSKRLRTLVDLEALLNDGTAYTLFFVLKGFAEGSDLTAAETVRLAPSFPRSRHARTHAFMHAPQAWTSSASCT